jgi:hypothetical protein
LICIKIFLFTYAVYIYIERERERERKYMKKSVIAIQPSVITTILVYALLAPIFFEMDNNAFGEGKYFVVDDNNNESDKTITTSNTQQK